MKRIAVVTISLLSLLVFQCAGPSPEQRLPSTVRPVHFGLAVPVPWSIPEFTPDSSIAQPELDRSFVLRFTVSPSGRVTTVTPETSTDSVYIAGYDDYFKLIEFAPGVAGGIDTTFELPVVMDVGPVEIIPRLRFPVEPNGKIKETDLYLKALSLNGVELPGIRVFPSYSCDLRRSDTSLVYPYMIFKLSLDEAGTVTAVDPLVSTFEKYTDQLRSAVHWGEYIPLRVFGRALPSVNYLVVLFFPAANYPTKVLTDGMTDSVSLYDPVRVTLLPDTVGLMAKPIPKGIWRDTLAYRLAPNLEEGPASANLAIDSLGVASILTVSPNPSFARQTRWHKLAERLRFYPARDLQGGTHPYRGRIFVDYVADTIIRVQFDWLPVVGRDSAR